MKGLCKGRELLVGTLSAIPFLAAAIGMALIGAHSDRTGERRFHVAVPAFSATLALVGAGLVSGGAGTLVCLSVAAIGIWGVLGPFWTIPSGFLRGSGAAAGIALVNSIGNLGGFLGPTLMGFFKGWSGDFSCGLYALAAGLAAAGCSSLISRSQACATK